MAYNKQELPAEVAAAPVPLRKPSTVIDAKSRLHNNDTILPSKKNAFPDVKAKIDHKWTGGVFKTRPKVIAAAGAWNWNSPLSPMKIQWTMPNKKPEKAIP